MPMTIIVTRNVSDKIRGFLASSMLEMAPGVYSAPKMSAAVRGRVWSVIDEWFYGEKEASIIMLWADAAQPGGQSVKNLGLPPVNLVDIDGLLLTLRV